MLIHLEGTVENDTIKFDLPQIYFKQGQKVAVLDLTLDYSRRITYLHGHISSSLVDKSPCNPKQQIFNIHQNQASSYMQFTPTHLSHYKIQCLDLNSSVFKIFVFAWNKSGNSVYQRNLIKRVTLTLLVSDARI